MRLGDWVVMILAMIIFLEFVGIPTGASAVLENFGITINPTTSELTNSDMANSTFFGWVFGNAGILLVLLGGGAIVIGLFAKSYDTSLIILPLVVSIGTTLFLTFSAILVYAQSIGQPWITALVGTIFIPIGAGFVMSCVDYFSGR